jgi:transcriptional regulator
MYLPKFYEVNDRSKLFDFMKNNSFGILFSHTGDEPMASHLPFVINEEGGEQGLIIGHMAKANDQWRYADGQQVMVVFSGPHTYVSPTWYQEDETVPTWDYVAVHATGIFKAYEDRTELEEAVVRLTDQHEASQPKPWELEPNTEYADQMFKRIVAFQIEITSIQGKWKLNQNQSDVLRERVSEKLKTLGGDANVQIASLIDDGMAG